MEVTLYTVLETYDDGDFDVSNEYYKSNDEYFAAVKKEFDMNSNVAYDVISNLGNVSKGRTTIFGSVNVKTNTKSTNYKAESVTLKNEDGNDETVDNFITNCVKDDVAVYTFNINPDKVDPEFEEDYLNWIGEHNSINMYVDKFGEDKVWENEPVRNIKVEFVNNANETKYAEFKNCKIIENDKANIYSCTILVENVMLIENI